MTTKKNQKKNLFTSLKIYRVDNEEIVNNNNIHLSSVIGPKKKENNKNYQMNFKFPQNDNKKKYKDKSRNKSGIKLSYYSFIEGVETINKTKKNFLKIRTVSKDKYKRNGQTFKTKVVKKSRINHVNRIIINLVRNDNDCNMCIKTDSNYYEKEPLYKNYINKIENNEDNDNLEKKDNNSNIKKNNFSETINIIRKRWKNNCVLSKQQEIPLLCNEIWNQKKEIEKIINRWNKEKKIVKKNFSFIKKEKSIKGKQINNFMNKWNNNIQKENKDNFTINKNINSDFFLYSEKYYIKDLVKNIYIPKNNNNRFIILNNDNYIKNFSKIDYEIIKPNNKKELEADLKNYYNEKKINYLKNKDNNEEQKINLIYILNDKQIKQLYEELNIQDKNSNNMKTNISPNFTFTKQRVIDYEIREFFTPKDQNKDNNTNPNSKRLGFYSNELKNDKISEINYKGKKKLNKYEDFGQVTPLKMLDEKFIIYAVIRTNKYSIPQKQRSLSYLNKNNNINDNSNVLKKSTFSFGIERLKNLDSFKSQKTNSKINNNNIIDFSKFSEDFKNSEKV